MSPDQIKSLNISLDDLRGKISGYDDLTPYSHLIEPFFFEHVLNIGWIYPKKKFGLGRVPSSNFDCLINIAFGDYSLKAIVEPARSLPWCPICEAEVEIERSGRLLCDSEIWIPGDGRIYSSPITVIHYIEKHNYLPPKEFLNAVVRVDPFDSFDAQSIYLQKLKECGWFKNQFGG